MNTQQKPDLRFVSMALVAFIMHGLEEEFGKMDNLASFGPQRQLQFLFASAGIQVVVELCADDKLGLTIIELPSMKAAKDNALRAKMVMAEQQARFGAKTVGSVEP